MTAVQDRAAAVRYYIDGSPDPGALYAFSMAAATWDAMRYDRQKGGTLTVDDDLRFAELTELCNRLGAKVSADPEFAMDPDGFLIGADRLLNQNWIEAAETWYGG